MRKIFCVYNQENFRRGLRITAKSAKKKKKRKLLAEYERLALKAPVRPAKPGTKLPKITRHATMIKHIKLDLIACHKLDGKKIKFPKGLRALNYKRSVLDFKIEKKKKKKKSEFDKLRRVFEDEEDKKKKKKKDDDDEDSDKKKKKKKAKKDDDGR